MISWLPQIATGISGTSASAAIRVAPLLISLISKDREIVASGKIPTISPALRYSTASRMDWAPSARSTLMWCIPRISGPAMALSKTSRLAINLGRRPVSFQAP